MMKYHFLIALFLLITLEIGAQKKKNKQEPPPQTVAAPSSVLLTKIHGLKKFPGFIEFYYDEKQDKIFLLIRDLQKEFLYIESITAGVGSNDIGLDRNQLGRERIVKFERRGPKILIIEPNYAFRAISDNPAEKVAVEEAFAQSVLWGFTITAEENGQLLVDASDFFLQDSHEVAETLREAKQGNYSLDRSRSAFYLPRTKNFPQNTEFEITLTYTGQATGAHIQSVVPTPSAVTIRAHHSFVQLPDLDYKSRTYDPRAGFNSIGYFDFATPISQPIQKKLIVRHRLNKKDPSAAMSEAIEPIIYYMDPGAPEPIRSALMEGATWWNQAFESAGYKDAFQVKVLPDDADPMDVRYNVINWVHRSTRGWSYGSSIVDPRTGEIIKGHVTLGSLRVRQDFLIAEGLLAPYEEGKPVNPVMEEMALKRLRQLAAHEVGHTLGLAHAYSSSAENLASVMDYPHPYVTLKDGKIDLSEAYDNKIGAFDRVTITYGYQDFVPGTNEQQALSQIIEESLKNGLTFLSDQDARPVGGAHPYAHLWDNGSDAADELLRVLEVRTVALKNFGENNIPPGTPMALLEEALVPVYFFHRYQTEATVKAIGGLNYRYALRGDGQPVAELLTPQQEIKALEALLKTIEPANLMLPEALLRLIPPRPLGYQRHRELMQGRTDLAFDALAAAETAADMTFSAILHPARANRVFEHHSRDARLPSLESVLDKLITATIKATPKSGYTGAVQMATDYALFSGLAGLAAHKNASPPVKAITFLKLDQMKLWTTQRSNVTADEEWKAFYAYLSSMISRLQDDPDTFQKPEPQKAPPGQPIGDFEIPFCGY